MKEGYTTAIVEAGHFYADKPISSEELRGAEIGLQVLHNLQSIGLEVIPCILVDNYNATDTQSQTNLSLFAEFGYPTDVVFWERDVIPEAQEILKKLDQTNKTKFKKGKTYLKEGFSLLQGDYGKYSCALLDAALYLKKFSLFQGFCVTVLPEQYKDQQETTKRILKTAGHDIPILNIYYGRNGQTNQLMTDFAY